MVWQPHWRRIGGGPAEGWSAGRSGQMNMRLPAVLVFVVACASMLSGGTALSAASPKQARVSAKSSTVQLNGNGLGVTRYGATQASATKAISAVLGKPTGHPSADCTSEYFQTAWHDLVVQFVAGRFRGYRYLAGGKYGVAPTAAMVRSTTPRLATAAGITVGSSLADAKRAYRTLARSATNFDRTQSGITFAFWSSGSPSPSSRIYEIKSNVCPGSL